VCTTIFDRFAQFGAWQRYQVYYVVAAFWVFQLAVSKPWLEHFPLRRRRMVLAIAHVLETSADANRAARACRRKCRSA
jgi:hypothetical protein